MSVGVIGGGQLARMMIPPAIEMGIDIRVLAESEGSSARLAATTVGDYRDVKTVQSFAKSVDVITFDHEHVPLDVLQSLEEDSIQVRPGSHALRFAQDKTEMRSRIAGLNVPSPRWLEARTKADVDDFLQVFSDQEVIAKTPRGGYDGKGVRVVRSSEELEDWLGKGPVLLEEKIEFVREVAQLIARRPSGEVALWPVVETTQRDGMCAEVVAPAPSSGEVQQEASHIARTIVEGLDVTGVLAVEMFHTRDGRLLVNELAMRPHNSGHIFTELSRTSQFEQHLRAVLDWPLGATDLVDATGVMVNIIGGIDRAAMSAALADHPGAKVHDYGKTPRVGRKVGHVNVVGATEEDVLRVAREVAASLTIPAGEIPV